jgi:hypothetical protein
MSVFVLLAVKPEVFLELPLGCALRTFFGVNCPFCGMTRDFVAMASGNFALRNPFSPMMAVALFVAYPVALARGWKRESIFRCSYERRRNLLLTVLAIMFVANNLKLTGGY